jgi:hypothetical protein
MAKPLTRTKRTLKRMGPLTREVQKIQNDLVKLARRLDKLQTTISEAEGQWLIWQAETARLERIRTNDFTQGGIEVKHGRVTINGKSPSTGRKVKK